MAHAANSIDSTSSYSETQSRKRGTRCAVCTFCGACFKDDEVENASNTWTGTRCEVCVSCGKCMKAWGLVKDGEADTSTGATNWASAFKALDFGHAGQPPAMPAPAGSVVADESIAADTSTGATPGVAAACKEFGMDDSASYAARLGIKPPGQN